MSGHPGSPLDVLIGATGNLLIIATIAAVYLAGAWIGDHWTARQARAAARRAHSPRGVP